MANIHTTQRVLVLPDIHIPNHDRGALKIVDDFRRDFRPHVTVFLGDLIDADAISDHAKGSDRITQLREYELAKEVLDQFKPTVFCEGNHEERFRRPGLVAPELWEILSPKRWFDIAKRGIRWVPYSNRRRDLFRIGKMTFIHGFCTNQYAARAEAESFGCVCFGHTHRQQTYQPKHARWRHTGYNIGCLCKLDLAYQTKGRPRGWCQGFGHGIFEERTGNFAFRGERLIGPRWWDQGGKAYARR